MCLTCTRTRLLLAQVYLHVIHYNEAAMRFYERNGFQRLRLIKCT